jgi:hypothetical protein
VIPENGAGGGNLSRAADGALAAGPSGFDVLQPQSLAAKGSTAWPTLQAWAVLVRALVPAKEAGFALEKAAAAKTG